MANSACGISACSRPRSRRARLPAGGGRCVLRGERGRCDLDQTRTRTREFNGNTRNNICRIDSEVPSLAKVNDFLSILHEPEDPDPSRRFKCVYIAHPPFEDVARGRSAIGPNEKRWGAFVAATSADGLTWKVVGDRPMNAETSVSRSRDCIVSATSTTRRGNSSRRGPGGWTAARSVG